MSVVFVGHYHGPALGNAAELQRRTYVHPPALLEMASNIYTPNT